MVSVALLYFDLHEISVSKLAKMVTSNKQHHNNGTLIFSHHASLSYDELYQGPGLVPWVRRPPDASFGFYLT